MTYEQLDAIADGVNPVLAALTLILPFLFRPSQQYARAAFFFSTAVSMGAMYGIAWFDQLVNLWPAFHLDYSGHTGFAAVLVFSLIVWNRRLAIPLVLTLVAYVALMLYQKYHTIADVLTTALLIVPLTVLFHRAGLALDRRRQFTTARSH